jgi:hypothetical protein
MKAKVKHVVKPVVGMPHHYSVISSDGVTEYKVNLIDRGGRGSCECPGYVNHVLRTRRLECCSHISDAREYELSLPAFDPAQLRCEHENPVGDIQQPNSV